MQLYIYKNNQQTGPFDEETVLNQLRSGALSAGDLGIRQGDSGWTPLGDIFAGRISEPSVFAPAPRPMAAAGQNFAAAAGPPPKSAGGCRVALGILMLVFGLLMFVGGLGIAVATPYVYYMPLCPIAESDYAEVEQLKKKYDAADEYEKIAIQFELERAIDSYDSSSRMCANERGTRQWFIVGSAAVAIVGLIMAIIGFFVRRVRRV
jgi:hypothetical protein